MVDQTPVALKSLYSFAQNLRHSYQSQVTEEIMNAAETGPTSGVAFRSNCEVAIHVPDLARAETFYRDVLGFTLVNQSADQLEFDTGVFRLYVNRDAQAVFSYIPSLDVPDYKAARAHLEAAGCATVRVNADSDLVYFKDPFGLVFDIIERR